MKVPGDFTHEAFLRVIDFQGGACACGDENCGITIKTCLDCGGKLKVTVLRNRAVLGLFCQACNMTTATFKLEPGGS